MVDVPVQHNLDGPGFPQSLVHSVLHASSSRPRPPTPKESTRA